MNHYLDRYAYPEQLFLQEPDPEVKIITVVPCFDEPNIIGTLNSLNDCESVSKIEIIVIVNEADDCSDEIRQNNLLTISQIEEWQRTVNHWFNLLFYHIRLPKKDAGVGLARKIGMDEAVRRFEVINNPRGVIACFDADSSCSKTYFKALFNNYYNVVHNPVGSSIYYEHWLPQDEHHRKGIIEYELHLRYYVHALRLISYPHAFQTVGSSMVVRSDMYQRIGGMNKRKAGEDFYFLHRLIPAGRFTDITEATIYPSPRVSTRVPFGTGKAMQKWTDSGQKSYETYSLESFIKLKSLFEAVDDLMVDGLKKSSLHSSILTFLNSIHFDVELARLQKQSKSIETFRKNFFAFFDGFKVLKFLHFSRDHYFPNQPIHQEASKLAQICWPESIGSIEQTEDLLDFYRKVDKGLI